jgi:hypothetical protein
MSYSAGVEAISDEGYQKDEESSAGRFLRTDSQP